MFSFTFCTCVWRFVVNICSIKQDQNKLCANKNSNNTITKQVSGVSRNKAIFGHAIYCRCCCCCCFCWVRVAWIFNRMWVNMFVDVNTWIVCELACICWMGGCLLCPKWFWKMMIGYFHPKTTTAKANSTTVCCIYAICHLLWITSCCLLVFL